MTRPTKEGQRLFEMSQKRIPGGVNSPVRAFKGVGGTPFLVDHGSGPYLFDVDGNRYIDYICSWGPLLLGHAHPGVTAAVIEAAKKGTSFGCPTPLELEMAELLCESVPTVEVVRMVNSGTEAAMSAIRLARGFTGRNKILKFEGCYHGHADALLAKAGSGVATFGIPGTPGVPADTVKDTLTVPYNDLEAVQHVAETHTDELAAIIVEPVAGNMGFVTPVAGFLQKLRTVCDETGAVLIFDEVMTGFRVAFAGAQGHFDIKPDLTVLGKVIGGGLPVGAYGGRADIMRHIAPDGPVYQAGTLSGNPIAVAAGLAALRTIRDDETLYERVGRAVAKLTQGLSALGEKYGVPIATDSLGTMFGFSFRETSPRNYEEAAQADTKRFASFFHKMLDAGVYFAPSAFEAGFVSTAHSPEVIDETLAAADRVLASL